MWLLCQHLNGIAYSAVIWDESRHWRPAELRGTLSRIYSAYLWIVIADALMMVLTYDDPLKGYRITWNIIKTVIFIVVIVYEKWLKRRTY